MKLISNAYQSVKSAMARHIVRSSPRIQNKLMHNTGVESLAVKQQKAIAKNMSKITGVDTKVADPIFAINNFELEARQAFNILKRHAINEDGHITAEESFVEEKPLNKLDKLLKNNEKFDAEQKRKPHDNEAGIFYGLIEPEVKTAIQNETNKGIGSLFVGSITSVLYQGLAGINQMFLNQNMTRL